jgi:Txe/YoeB family toxin of Txe-Axe toxin-antitoxin module
MATRITRLIREIQRDPFNLVYRADDKEVKILKVRYHYGND